MTSYTYSIQNDTPNHRVDSDSLTLEIRASAIATALDHIGTTGDVLTIWFKADLSVSDQVVLTSVVAAHQGVQTLTEAVTPVSFQANMVDATGGLIVNSRTVSGTLHIGYVYCTIGQSGVVDFGGDTDWSYSYTPTQTILTYWPSFKYYIDGGGFQMLAPVTSGDIKVKVAIAPQIPYAYGGNRVIVSNKLLVAGESYEIQVPPKFVPYISGVPANLVQMTVDHQSDENSKVEFFLRLYI